MFEAGDRFHEMHRLLWRGYKLGLIWLWSNEVACRDDQDQEYQAQKNICAILGDQAVKPHAAKSDP